MLFLYIGIMGIIVLVPLNEVSDCALHISCIIGVQVLCVVCVWSNGYIE